MFWGIVVYIIQSYFMDQQQSKEFKTKTTGGMSKRTKLILLHILLGIVILAIIGTVIVFFLLCRSDKKSAQNAEQELQQQVKTLQEEMQCSLDQQLSDSQAKEQEDQEADSHNGLSEFHTGKYYYILESAKNPDDPYDQHVVRIERGTQKQETIVTNIRSLLPELQDRFNETLMLFLHPWNSNTVYFAEILSETDSPSRQIFAFDVDTKTFRSMNINSEFDGVGHTELSPDGLYFIWIPFGDDEFGGDDQDMYLVSLKDDSMKKIVSLSGVETFNAADQTLLAKFSVEWSRWNIHIVQYGVYNQLDKPPVVIDPSWEGADPIDFRDVIIEY